MLSYNIVTWCCHIIFHTKLHTTLFIFLVSVLHSCAYCILYVHCTSLRINYRDIAADWSVRRATLSSGQLARPYYRLRFSQPQHKGKTKVLQKTSILRNLFFNFRAEISIIKNLIKLLYKQLAVIVKHFLKFAIWSIYTFRNIFSVSLVKFYENIKSCLF
jgi:hypothetical protein